MSMSDDRSVLLAAAELLDITAGQLTAAGDGLHDAAGMVNDVSAGIDATPIVEAQGGIAKVDGDITEAVGVLARAAESLREYVARIS
jgi:hypothetical protein